MRDARRSIPPHGLQWPLHIAVAAGVAVLVACIVGALAYTSYRGAQNALNAAADDSVQQIATLLDERIGRIFEPADRQLRLLALGDFARADTLEKRLALQPLAREVMRENEIVQALFAGYPNGDFILFRPLDLPALSLRFSAPRGADLLVQTITTAQAGTVGEFRFYGPDGQLLEHRVQPDYAFDPRGRPWYERARETRETVLTEPYIFFTTRVPGVTLARRTVGGEAVIGLDAEFANLAAQIDELRMTASTELAIVAGDGTVVAHHDPSAMLIPESGDGFRLARVSELARPLLAAAFELDVSAGIALGGVDGGRGWKLARVPLRPVGSLQLSALMAIPKDEMFAQARRITTDQVLVALLIFAVSVPFGVWLTQRTVRSLRRLADETAALEAFDFAERPLPRSPIREIDRLALGIDRMRGTLAEFLDTSVALGVERDVGELLETILRTVTETVGAHGGAIYRLDDAGGLERVRARGEEARLSAGDGSLVDVALARRATCVEPAGDEVHVAVPLITRDGIAVGAILVWLPVSGVPGDAHRDARVGYIEALSATAAVAIETRELIDAQKRLLDSFIELIAAAIDAKSPYTGGHCQRVPALAKMLAEAAHDSDDPVWREFRLGETDREALHIAAWLHDCGKITTPEHVVDKATKLECIYDRIHEVRMRFEVLKRDARIQALEARLAGEDAAAVAERLEAALAALDDDFAFVAQCNLGGEAMDDAAIERLHRIAERRWLRTLDDRLGISREEAQRRGAEPPVPLPAEEPLLADRPWHRIERPAEERFGDDNPWGFRMAVPRYKYDRGELHNLTVRRGTLTAEDRYIINHHMIQTIMMLERLPFPRHLAGVPEIAGGHHERMDGMGYPRRLRREDMSVLARTMAVADVFEALTAADRPYKAAKTLSESVAIMADMVTGQHLDPDLFRLFLESGVYREYARRFLSPEQIDAVDVPAMLARAGCAPASA